MKEGKKEGMQAGDSREQHALPHGLRQAPGRDCRLVQRLQVVDDGHGAAQRAQVARRVMHQVLRTFTRRPLQQVPQACCTIWGESSTLPAGLPK